MWCSPRSSDVSTTDRASTAACISRRAASAAAPTSVKELHYLARHRPDGQGISIFLSQPTAMLPSPVVPLALSVMACWMRGLRSIQYTKSVCSTSCR